MTNPSKQLLLYLVSLLALFNLTQAAWTAILYTTLDCSGTATNITTPLGSTANVLTNGTYTSAVILADGYCHVSLVDNVTVLYQYAGAGTSRCVSLSCGVSVSQVQTACYR